MPSESFMFSDGMKANFMYFKDGVQYPNEGIFEYRNDMKSDTSRQHFKQYRGLRLMVIMYRSAIIIAMPIILA